MDTNRLMFSREGSKGEWLMGHIPGVGVAAICLYDREPSERDYRAVEARLLELYTAKLQHARLVKETAGCA